VTLSTHSYDYPVPQQCSKKEEYRATGIILVKLEEDRIVQLDLFGEAVRIEKTARVYAAMDWLR
jgi:hypothetical protein